VATEIRSWQIKDGQLHPVSNSLIETGRREKEDLEKWIKTNPAILGEDIAIIGEQEQTSSGPVDFLGVDSSGNIVIVELKRDKLPRDALAQAIDYASDIADWPLEKFQEICQRFTGTSFDEFFQQRFEEIPLEDLAINQVQRVLLVGFGIEESLSRMIEWLSDKYSIGINAILLNYVRTSSGDEVLSRTVIIPEELEKQKANKRKFIVRMSDEPSNYDPPELEKRLAEYLSKNLYSAQRIKDHFLPILIEKDGTMTRSQLLKEFVKRGAAENESQAGYYMSLISNQLGHEWKGFLRQVISYGTPNQPWEKDNFKIREGYEELVKKVLAGFE